MKHFLIDYETYFDKSLKISVTQQGVLNYIRDGYAYIVSVVSDDIQWVGEVEKANGQNGAPDIAQIISDPEVQCWAANANFDQAWTTKLYGKSVRPWKCVLDLGAHHQLPTNLGSLAAVVLGKRIDKGLRDSMDRKHWKDISEAEKTAMLEYCLGDSVEARKIIHTLPPMTRQEDMIAAHTRLLNRRGVHIDTDLMENDKTELGEYKHRKFLEIPWRQTRAPGSPIALKEFCAAHGFEAPESRAKDDEDCTILMSQHPELDAVLTSLREFGKANAMIKKIDSILDRTTEDGLMPLELRYCGAPHTRRWSAAGVNVQNLVKEPIMLVPGNACNRALELLGKKPMESEGQALLRLWKFNQKTPIGVKYTFPRHWIIPPPGKTFLIMDLAQVEPRCLAWLVNNEALLSLVRQGFGIYEAYARSVGDWTGNEPLRDGNPTLYKDTKSDVIGLGYGMGADKYSAKEGMSLEEAQKRVKGYREKNPLVPRFWRDLDNLVKQAALDREKILKIQMPTGEYLNYFGVRAFARKMPDGSTRRGFEGFTRRGAYDGNSYQANLWGGTLCENVTQRMARDILAGALIELEKAGLPVCFTSHDEVILVVDDDLSKKEAKETAERIMSTSPEWCPDLPVGVEGDFSPRYTK